MPPDVAIAFSVDRDRKALRVELDGRAHRRSLAGRGEARAAIVDRFPAQPRARRRLGDRERLAPERKAEPWSISGPRASAIVQRPSSRTSMLPRPWTSSSWTRIDASGATQARASQTKPGGSSVEHLLGRERHPRAAGGGADPAALLQAYEPDRRLVRGPGAAEMPAQRDRAVRGDPRRALAWRGDARRMRSADSARKRPRICADPTSETITSSAISAQDSRARSARRLEAAMDHRGMRLRPEVAPGAHRAVTLRDEWRGAPGAEARRTSAGPPRPRRRSRSRNDP